ncbi:MAG TPA: hypothetical protein VGL72_05395 [Bryobacteraceae bacterium]
MKIVISTAVLITAGVAWSQEASSGFDLRTTVSAGLYEGSAATETPRNGSSWVSGVRVMLYPTLKFDDHWSVSGAVQVHSRPYFAEEMATQGYGLRSDVLQATLNYSRFWHRGSLVVRAGELSSAFGSYLLHYDDADNPLINAPKTYGYYYAPVTTLGLMGAEADVTWRNLDARAQFVNSSPANRRSIFDHDQYGNWAGGFGYTIRQGLRVGISGYSGPYLDRQFPFYFPGEASPRDLPARAFGMDAQWAAGHWNVQGEMQRFEMEYRLIPTFREQAAYIEVRRVLHPRWFIAERTGYIAGNELLTTQDFEAVLGFRPDSRQIIKVGYGLNRTAGAGGSMTGIFQLQLVTMLHPLAMAIH